MFLFVVPITRVFSCQKIHGKRSPLVFVLKELNFTDIVVSGVFREI